MTSERKCMQAPIGRGSYCGSTSYPVVTVEQATCANCLAAFRADERAAK
jgi:hypothetical protein